MRGVAVGGHIARPHLALAFALGHLPSLALRARDLRGEEVDAPARGVDAGDLHTDVIAKSQRRSGALTAQSGVLVAQLPPLALAARAAQRARGQQALIQRRHLARAVRRGRAGARRLLALVAGAEGHEGARSY